MPHSLSTSSSEDVRRFTLKLVLMAIALVLMDRSAGALAQYLFLRTTDGDTGEQVNGLLTSRAPVVVFGSSRAESHYVPEVLESELGVKVFNGGYKGSNALYDYGVQQLTFRKFLPRVVIYDFSAVAVARSDADPFERLEPLYPFHDDPAIWSMISERGTLQRTLFLSHLYPYNSKLHSLILFNIIKNRPGASQGYVPQDSVMPDRAPGTLNWTERRYDPRLVTALRELLESAANRGSRVIVVISPHYSLGSYDIPTEIQSVLDRYGIPVLDFNGPAFTQFLDHHLYRDESHLNDTGARLFSRVLGGKIASMDLLTPPASAGG